MDNLTSTKHLLAGNAVFTIRENASGERFTYHFYSPKNGKNKGKMLLRLLIGPDNTADYTEIGEANRETGEVTLSGMYAIRNGKPLIQASVAKWLVALALQGADTPETVTITHAGQCLRCGKVLTVPYPDNPYRVYGLGPECGRK